jgi:hypothetical protein
MAKRVLNRRQLRSDAEQAARTEPTPQAEVPAEAAAPAAKAPRKRPSRKKEPARLRARWGVFNNAMKQVAIYDYNQRGEAEQKLADLNARKTGEHFLQIVKEPMPALPAPDAPPAAKAPAARSRARKAQ